MLATISGGTPCAASLSSPLSTAVAGPGAAGGAFAAKGRMPQMHSYMPGPSQHRLAGHASPAQALKAAVLLA